MGCPWRGAGVDKAPRSTKRTLAAGGRSRRRRRWRCGKDEGGWCWILLCGSRAVDSKPGDRDAAGQRKKQTPSMLGPQHKTPPAPTNDLCVRIALDRIELYASDRCLATVRCTGDPTTLRDSTPAANVEFHEPASLYGPCHMDPLDAAWALRARMVASSDCKCVFDARQWPRRAGPRGSEVQSGGAGVGEPCGATWDHFELRLATDLVVTSVSPWLDRPRRRATCRLGSWRPARVQVFCRGALPPMRIPRVLALGVLALALGPFEPQSLADRALCLVAAEPVGQLGLCLEDHSDDRQAAKALHSAWAALVAALAAPQPWMPTLVATRAWHHTAVAQVAAELWRRSDARPGLRLCFAPWQDSSRALGDSLEVLWESGAGSTVACVSLPARLARALLAAATLPPPAQVVLLVGGSGADDSEHTGLWARLAERYGERLCLGRATRRGHLEVEPLGACAPTGAPWVWCGQEQPRDTPPQTPMDDRPRQSEAQ